MPAGASEFLASATLVDALLAMMVLEAVALGLFHRATGRGLPVQALTPNLLSGALLLLALRSVLSGHPAVMPAWLAAAFLAHLADLAVRWNR